jgi:saccharopine dehydrogenase-like NADP-dependent oxidoreductase
MKRNVLIIGAGAVAHVAAHKAAMHNDALGDICIASRTLAKAEAIVASVHERGHLKDPSGGCTRASSTRSTSRRPSRSSRRPARRSC